MSLFGDLRDDYRRHDARLGNPALWALAVFRAGRSAETLPAPARGVARRFVSVMRIGVEAATGISIHPGMTVGERVHFIHGANIRIHPDTIIGARVGIAHDVTIGTAEVPGTPIIEDDVFIGPGAKILGPVRIGQGAIICANSLVITDIPAGATALGVPARPLPKKRSGTSSDSGA